MNESSFVDRREPDWRRLTMLCDRADASPANLNYQDFQDLVRLYRKTSTDLATARTQSANGQMIDFLNDLVARSYAILYRSPRNSFGHGFMVAIRTAADTIRRSKWFLLVSLSVFVAGGFFAFFVIDYSPDVRAQFVPENFKSSFKNWEDGETPERTSDESAEATSLYASNNPRVAIMTGAVAASTFGIGTFMMVWQNGVIMGTLIHEVRPHGKVGFLLTSVAPHSVPEISGLLVSGASGFVMGWALIRPGRRSRGEALKAAGKDAIVLLATGVCLMFIAAPIEGFFSFNPNVPGGVKILVACIEVIAWAAFWMFYGKGEEDKEARG
jgi:uncharacterized membrane protein SpoIIM required for sporulation